MTFNNFGTLFSKNILRHKNTLNTVIPIRPMIYKDWIAFDFSNFIMSRFISNAYFNYYTKTEYINHKCIAI